MIDKLQKLEVNSTKEVFKDCLDNFALIEILNKRLQNDVRAAFLKSFDITLSDSLCEYLDRMVCTAINIIINENIEKEKIKKTKSAKARKSKSKLKSKHNAKKVVKKSV